MCHALDNRSVGPCAHFNNTEEDCNAILKPADWLPSFDKYAPQIFNTTSPMEAFKEHTNQLHWWTTRPSKFPSWATRPHHPWKPEYADENRKIDTLSEYRLVLFPEMVSGPALGILGKEKNRRELLGMQWSHDAAIKLQALN
jgi:hypothetical protein